MGQPDGKVAVITGGSSGMALAGAKLFVEQGAHVLISGRRQQAASDDSSCVSGMELVVDGGTTAV